ncbi:MAG: SLATT domain-containing protein [Treponema sp.]|nr:SLATT domain-containing protein [Treponema sp.]
MQKVNNISESATEEITDNIWKTSRCMFNAHNRLITISKLQKFCTIAIALYILAISIIILNNKYFSQDTINWYNVYLIILSVISLTLSLTIGESGNKIKAKKFQSCGRELQHLYNSILLKLEQNPEYKLSDEENRRKEILDKYSNIRPLEIDYQYFKHEKYKKNKIKYFFVLLFHIKYFIFTKLIYLILLILPILGMLFIQFYKNI